MPDFLHICIPLMDELDHLPVLLDNIEKQDSKNFKAYFCVNQPESWWDDPEKKEVCERNQESISFLKKYCNFEIEVIDKSGKGKAWSEKHLGVGWARKTCMDAVLDESGDEDIMITLDGDTSFNGGYFSSVNDNFRQHRDAVGLSVPYYHKLTGKEAEDRAILRYEIYMRNYAINLWRIGNPYSFTALGSAMALPVRAYKAIGGMTPKKSGEDFYFLQKLCKYGRLLRWNEEKVYPAARFSDRVFFGTGPAMIRGAAGDWSTYPVYHHTLFDQVKETYDLFNILFEKDVPLPMDEFFSEILAWKDPWQPLRNNNKNVEGFKRACRDKVDGLRILQFLKYSSKNQGYSDADALLALFGDHYPLATEKFDFLAGGFNFDDISVEQLNALRDFLVHIEERYQLENHVK